MLYIYTYNIYIYFIYCIYIYILYIVYIYMCVCVNIQKNDNLIFLDEFNEGVEHTKRIANKI